MNQLGYIDVRDYGAKGDGSTDDTLAIQAAFTAANSQPGATVFIPPGEYMVGDSSGLGAVRFAATDCKLTGGGTLKYRLGCNNIAVLRVSGERNIVEWIRIDANWSGGAAAVDGFFVAGKLNCSRNVLVFNVAPGPEDTDPKGDCLQNLGTAGTMYHCIALGGYTSLRDGGDYNKMRYCVGLEYTRKGYNNSAKTTHWTCAIGVHTESTYVSTTGAAGYQIDPEEPDSTFDRAIFRDCTGRPDTDPGSTTSNGAKFARLKDVYLDGCQFLHAETQCTTLRIAERVERVRVKDTFLARDFFFESMLTPYPEEVRLERVIIGDGTQEPNYAVGRGRCDILTISDSVLTGYKLGGIEWRGPDGTYTLIAATNCDFNGNLPSNIPPAPPATSDIEAQSGGQLNRSGKLLWLGNRRANIGAGGLSRFTDPIVINELLGTTQDVSISVYAGAASPTGSLATWNLGDIVVNTSPTAGGYYGWVCTNPASPPGTWKQWGAIST